jgi:hypothetical protein
MRKVCIHTNCMNTMVQMEYTIACHITMVCIPYNGMNTWYNGMLLLYSLHSISMVCIPWYRHGMHTIPYHLYAHNGMHTVVFQWYTYLL